MTVSVLEGWDLGNKQCCYYYYYLFNFWVQIINSKNLSWKDKKILCFCVWAKPSDFFIIIIIVIIIFSLRVSSQVDNITNHTPMSQRERTHCSSIFALYIPPDVSIVSMGLHHLLTFYTSRKDILTLKSKIKD